MYHSSRQKRPWLLLIHHPLKNIKKTLLSSHVGVLLGQSAPQHTSQYFVKNSDAIGFLRRPEVLASLEFHSESRGQFSLPRFLLLVPQTQFQTQALLPPSLCALPLILSFHHCPLPSPFHSSSCSHVNSHQSSLHLFTEQSSNSFCILPLSILTPGYLKNVSLTCSLFEGQWVARAWV